MLMLSNMVQYGSIWFNMVQHGLKPALLVPIDRDLFRQVANGNVIQSFAFRNYQLYPLTIETYTFSLILFNKANVSAFIFENANHFLPRSLSDAPIW